MVVLAAQLEVAQHYGDLCTGDDQDDKYQAQEAEEIVELVQPHGGEDEEQLNEDCSKWQNAAYQNAEQRIHVPSLHNNKRSISF